MRGKTVFVLCQTSHEECHHHGLWDSVDDAKDEARRIDDAWDPYPGWNDTDGVVPLGTPHEWTYGDGPDGLCEFTATGVGYARWWCIREERIR